MEKQNANYKAEVKECTKELTGKEKVALKNFADMIQLDEATQNAEGAGVIIDVDYVAQVHVHNEKADNPDYMKFIYVDKDGTMYISGSEPLYRQYTDIAEDMKDEKEPWSIKVIRKQSDNYKGKDFLTCVII